MLCSFLIMPLFVFGITVMLILHHDLETISKGLCRIFKRYLFIHLLFIYLFLVLVENSPFGPVVLCENKLTISLLFFGIYKGYSNYIVVLHVIWYLSLSSSYMSIPCILFFSSLFTYPFNLLFFKLGSNGIMKIKKVFRILSPYLFSPIMLLSKLS